MITVILLLLLTGLLAITAAAVVGWQFILAGIAACIVIKMLKKHVFNRS